jgi:hypothetical protein
MTAETQGQCIELANRDLDDMSKTERLVVMPLWWLVGSMASRRLTEVGRRRLEYQKT